MQKEELLHLHVLMIHIKKYYERITNEEIQTERYTSMRITPVHIHKGKNAHKQALLTLADEIVSYIHEKPVPALNYSSVAALQKVAAEN